jgi:hypothetical protein
MMWHGEGTLLTAEGTKYVGDFRNGKRHGQGEYLSKTYLYNGEWREDKMHGAGVIVYTNGSAFAGSFA